MKFDSEVIKSFLEKYDNWYKDNKEDIKDIEEQAFKLLNEFKHKFPVDNIENMLIDDYVEGKSDKDNFCYWVENKLRCFGGIGGKVTADQKFGIYFSRETNSYIFTQKRKSKFGTSPNEVFSNIKIAIKDLLDATYAHDMERIAKNKLCPLFKHKLSYLYDDDKWIGCYSDKDLNVFLTIFNIPFDIKSDRIYKRDLLFQFYKALNRKNMSTFLFSRFIYDLAGYRNEILSNTQKEYIAKHNKDIDILSVNSFKEIKYLGNLNKSGQVKINPSLELEKKACGVKGENIVIEFLKKHKKQLQISKIDAVCTYDDYKHYDIRCLKIDRSEIFIEVKSTKSNNENINFNISREEYDFAKEHEDNYYIYYVNNVNDPKIIKKIKGSDILKFAQPTEYKISVEIA